MTANDRVNLLEWYKANRRPLPWRENRDPYRIWISEVMLQQTTVEAVKPYYERFLQTFPNLQALAEAPLPAVLEKWAGLGYYSRARNLHKAAIALSALPRFPHSYAQLLELPGFGPYTARAVSSIAFGEPVGVIDGNVIRVISRRLGREFLWWENSTRKELQTIADLFVAPGPSDQLNQALMELGATVCTPKSPKCIHCPWLKTCEARKKNLIDHLPVKRERRAKELWLWQPTLHFDGQGRLYFEKNLTGPFLRNQLLPPGTFERLKTKPQSFDLRHSITHHDIFIDVQTVRKSKIKTLDGTWLAPQDVAKTSPFSILKKIFTNLQKVVPHDETKKRRSSLQPASRRLSQRPATRR
jgi:A/G-specific adenine glycosylase